MPSSLGCPLSMSLGRLRSPQPMPRSSDLGPTRTHLPWTSPWTTGPCLVFALDNPRSTAGHPFPDNVVERHACQVPAKQVHDLAAALPLGQRGRGPFGKRCPHEEVPPACGFVSSCTHYICSRFDTVAPGGRGNDPDKCLPIAGAVVESPERLTVLPMHRNRDWREAIR